MGIKKETAELIRAGIINPETGLKIEEYFKEKKGNKTNRILLIFGVIGSVLIGLGIILLLKHNWEDIPRGVKTTLSFIPLLIGQGLCAYTLFRKKRENLVWRECSAAFLFLAVGANIALISQVYNISGQLDQFLIVWALLTLPLIYIMGSSVASAFSITVTTIYINTIQFDNLFSGGIKITMVIVPLLIIAATLPHYLIIRKKNPASEFLTFFHWAYPTSGFWLLSGAISDEIWPVTYLGYMTLLMIYILIGNSRIMKKTTLGKNGFRIIGVIGLTVLLFIISFLEIMEEMTDLSEHSIQNLSIMKLFSFSNFSVALILLIIVFTLLIFHIIRIIREEGIKKTFTSGISVLSIVPVFLLTFFLIQILFGIELYPSKKSLYGSSIFLTVFVNIILFAESIVSMVRGILRDRPGLFNWGLILFITLVSCRFFFIFDISFTAGGILFIILGAGFLTVNILLSKKRKAKITENPIEEDSLND